LGTRPRMGLKDDMFHQRSTKTLLGRKKTGRGTAAGTTYEEQLGEWGWARKGFSADGRGKIPQKSEETQIQTHRCEDTRWGLWGLSEGGEEAKELKEESVKQDRGTKGQGGE